MEQGGDYIIIVKHKSKLQSPFPIPSPYPHVLTKSKNPETQFFGLRLSLKSSPR